MNDVNGGKAHLMAYWVDDTFDTWPEVFKAGTAAAGLYLRCGVWICRNTTDGYIPAEVAASYGTREWAQRLVDVGLWETVSAGYRDARYLDMNPTAAKAKLRKAQATKRQALFRDPALREAVRLRDQDRCRYCGTKVKWTDRKGPKGGTYDHIDPFGPNEFENLVVCCRSCNSMKRDRTPEEAGMTLLTLSDLNRTQVGSKSDLVSHIPPSLPPSKEGKGQRAPASPGGARAAPNTHPPPDIAQPPDLTQVREQLRDASRKAHAPKRTDALDELRRLVPDTDQPT